MDGFDGDDGIAGRVALSGIGAQHVFGWVNDP